jgi:hypothetical protein
MERSRQCQCRSHLRSRFVTYSSLCPGRFPGASRVLPGRFPGASGRGGRQPGRPGRQAAGSQGWRGRPTRPAALVGLTRPTSTMGHIDHGPALTFPVRRSPARVSCPVPAHFSREMWAGGARVTEAMGGEAPAAGWSWPRQCAGSRPGRGTCRPGAKSPGHLVAAPMVCALVLAGASGVGGAAVSCTPHRHAAPPGTPGQGTPRAVWRLGRDSPQVPRPRGLLPGRKIAGSAAASSRFLPR